jgi:hypothetical protein
MVPNSPVAGSAPQSLIPASMMAALNRSVCPIAQAAMNRHGARVQGEG